jgi:hypothetical protein
MTKQRADALRERFEARCTAYIQAETGKILQKAAIPVDSEGRGRRSRQYASGITNFAMQAFCLNEQLDLANDALQELCRLYLSDSNDLHEAHSFHWCGATYGRLWEFFGPEGSRAANRMSAETQALMLEMMWAWAETVSSTLDPDPEHIWRVPNTENHHAMGAVTAWSLSKFLSRDRAYRDRVYNDDRTPAEHYAGWTAYFKTYFRSRAGKGQCIEIASNVYNGPTIQMWYNLFDFVEDPELRRLAGAFLDLYWASWAEDQIDGIRGGGQTRVYQRHSRVRPSGGLAKMASLYFGSRNGDRLSNGEWTVVTSNYCPPELVFHLALDIEGRGEYEATQRNMGLWEPGWERVSVYPVLPFGVVGLREDYGGILRYSYNTPDYIVGTLMVEALPLEEWSGAATQNRWQGVIFSGHPDARIVPECRTNDLTSNPRSDTYNQHWSVQKRSALVTQRLGSEYSREAVESRIWISGAGLSEPVEDSGWVFVQSVGAYAAIRVVDGGYVWEGTAKSPAGKWLRCRDNLSPIVIDVGRKSDFADLEDFVERIHANLLTYANNELNYTGLDGNALTLYADFSRIPRIDGLPVDYAPRRVYDSPHIQSDWDSGFVDLTYAGQSCRLDFNPNSPGA